MTARDDELRARLLATFRVEAEEHLASLTSHLLALEAGVAPEQAQERVAATFRAMHTLKGAARSVGLTDVEGLCQACELVLSHVVRGRRELDAGLIDRLQDAVDGIAGLISGQTDAAAARRLAGRLAHGADDRATATTESAAGPEPPPPDPEPSVPAPPPETAMPATIRLDAGKLDALLLQGEDLLGAKLAVGQRSREAHDLAAGIAAARRQLRGRRRTPRSDRSAGERESIADSAMAELRKAETGAREMLERLSRDEQLIGGAVDRLLEEVRRTRMMPVSTVLELFPRMVRDLARDGGKEIEWSSRGGELEVDRRVLEAVKDPLIHLIRNAIDHGIEQPETRVAAGKEARGLLTVTVLSREDGRVEIIVEDDGRGLDPARVRDAAVRTRLVTAPAADALSDEDALELVFRSGLSTSPVITDVSGHGLGLAIVREGIERVDGDIRLESRVGAGTRARMALPATIATFRGLLVRSAGQLFLVPLDAAEHVLGVRPGDVGTVEGRTVIRWRGEPVPVASLDALLELAGADDRSVDAPERTCVVVAAGQERAALMVDEVLGDEEVLVKDLTAPLVRVRCIAGAGMLASGRIGLILRAADLIRAARRAVRPPAPRAARDDGRAPLVLVVDDAVTTRTMERNLLEAAGYRVQTAVDGAEAWTMLKTEVFDLVVSDVDMPRMDGFELTTRIRADPGLEDLPVVLVTALEAREDKERGIEVGANAYVVKSSFDQSNLLEIIQRLGVVATESGAR